MGGMAVIFVEETRVMFVHGGRPDPMPRFIASPLNSPVKDTTFVLEGTAVSGVIL